MNIRNRAARGEHRSQDHSAGNLVLARGFGISRLGFLQHAGLGTDVLAAEDLAVVGAATTAAGTAATFASLAAAGITSVARAVTTARTGTDAAAGAAPNAITG